MCECKDIQPAHKMIPRERIERQIQIARAMKSGERIREDWRPLRRLSYQEGIIDALGWILGETDSPPLED